MLSLFPGQNRGDLICIKEILLGTEHGSKNHKNVLVL